MKLVPTHPPGRTNRKARGFADEIVRLRDLGYTLEAIREALFAAGVEVSISTVRREAVRGVAAPSPPAETAAPPPIPKAGTSRPPEKVETSRTSRAKDLAEAFVRKQIQNPLFNTKEPQ